jgi:arylsulfatase A-like enzyme/tetratricopeptide (TPR) repeat protein
VKRSRWVATVGLAAVAGAGAAAGIFLLRSALHFRALHRLKGANILLVTLDTTRANRLGCYGYADAETPALDALARDGVLFERCITPTAFTLPSHASIMTGRYPASHGVRINGDLALADAQTTLAERLSEAGYRTGAFIGAFVLDGRWGLKQGFDHYDDNFELKPGEQLDLAGVQRPGDKVVDAALAWLQQTDTRPFFAWVHLYDPHTPYEPPEPWRSRLNDSLSHLYDGEIAFADSQVGRLLDWLASQGLDKKTIVIAVGDHGEGLGSHGEAEHGYFVYEYAVHVPFIVRLPVGGFRGIRVPAQVRTIDLVPTLLELIGAGTPSGIDGESLTPLLGHPSREGPRFAFSESMSPPMQYGWSALYSIRTPAYKYIEAPKPELYDLRADPNEGENRIGRLPEVARELRAELEKIQEGMSAAKPETQEANIDEETMRRLASLGYIGGTMATKKSESKVLADPKDMLHLYNAVGIAARHITDKEFVAATAKLEGVLKEDPKNPQARSLLAMCYEKTERNAEAKAILDGVLKDDPENLRGLIAMAGLLGKEGRTEEMVAVCKRALAKDDRNAQAYALLADAYMGANDYAAALPCLQKAVEIQAKLTRNRINLAACLIGLRRFDEAEGELKGILSTHPKCPLAHFNLGLLYEEEARLREAREAYTTEIELNPNIVPARFNLANLLLRAGDVAAAEDQLRQLLQGKPDEPRANLFMARALLARSANPEEALRFVKTGLDKSTTPDQKALGYFLLADIYSRQGRRAEVEEALRNARYYQVRTAPVHASSRAH